MPLKVVTRKDTAALTIEGTVKFPDGTKQRVRQRAQSDDRQLAEEEAVALEAQMLRTAWHGERRGSRPFIDAVDSYLKAAPRRIATTKRLIRIVRALGDVTLAAVDQDAVDRVRDKALRPNPSPATIRAEIITPIRAVLNHAHRRGWCDPPHFEIPQPTAGRTLYLLPAEAQRLTAAAARHIKPLLIFLLCTGARMSEALMLDWRDVDLQAPRVIFQAWTTKGRRRRRVASLSPAAVAAIASLPHREGPVFRWETKPTQTGNAKRSATYTPKDGAGGQIKTAWAGAISRAGLDPAFTPHTLRHTWASWHYAIHRDLLLLKQDGGWQSVDQVERYAHLMPRGHEAAIMALWGVAPHASRELYERA